MHPSRTALLVAAAVSAGARGGDDIVGVFGLIVPIIPGILLFALGFSLLFCFHQTSEDWTNGVVHRSGTHGYRRICSYRSRARVPIGDAVIGSACMWSAAYAIYAVRYWPILTRPRLDGKPG